MISDYKVAKAFRDKLGAITTLPIQTQGASYTPSPDIDYIREKVVTGGTSILVGGNSTDTQRGFYQLDVCTVINKGKWFNLSIIDELKAFFAKGLTAGVAFDGQLVSIQNVDTSPMRKDDTHIMYSLTIYYAVVG